MQVRAFCAHLTNINLFIRVRPKCLTAHTLCAIPSLSVEVFSNTFVNFSSGTQFLHDQMGTKSYFCTPTCAGLFVQFITLSSQSVLTWLSCWVCLAGVAYDMLTERCYKGTGFRFVGHRSIISYYSDKNSVVREKWGYLWSLFERNWVFFVFVCLWVWMSFSSCLNQTS